MSETSREDVRLFLTRRVVELLGSQGQHISHDEITSDTDLLLSGLIDSLGLLELTEALNDYCGFEIDFDTLDPDDMTIVGPLCDFVAAQAAARPA